MKYLKLAGSILLSMGLGVAGVAIVARTPAAFILGLTPAPKTAA